MDLLDNEMNLYYADIEDYITTRNNYFAVWHVKKDKNVLKNKIGDVLYNWSFYLRPFTGDEFPYCNSDLFDSLEEYLKLHDIEMIPRETTHFFLS